MLLRALVTSGFWPVIVVKVADRGIQHLGVLGGFADADIDGNLGHPRHLHDGGVVVLLHQLRPHFFLDIFLSVWSYSASLLDLLARIWQIRTRFLTALVDHLAW